MGVANATQTSFLLTTAPSLPFGSTTATPEDEDEDKEGSKVSNTLYFVYHTDYLFSYIILLSTLFTILDFQLLEGHVN